MADEDAWLPPNDDDAANPADAAAKPADAAATPTGLSGFMLYCCRCLMQDRSLLALTDSQRGVRLISQWRRLSNGVKDKFNADAAALEGQFKLHLEVIALRDEHAMLTAELEARKARRRRRFTAVKKTGTVALDGDGDDVV